MSRSASIRSWACWAISAPWSQVNERRSCWGSVVIDAAMASRTAWAPCPARGGPVSVALLGVGRHCWAQLMRSGFSPPQHVMVPSVRSPQDWTPEVAMAVNAPVGASD